MSNRDELAVLIAKHHDAFFGVEYAEPAVQDVQLADALLAAGWTKPRTITTVEELDALAEWSVIIDQTEDTCIKRESGWWLSAEDGDQYHASALPLPATVLREPTP